MARPLCRTRWGRCRRSEPRCRGRTMVRGGTRRARHRRSARPPRRGPSTSQRSVNESIARLPAGLLIGTHPRRRDRPSCRPSTTHLRRIAPSTNRFLQAWSATSHDRLVNDLRRPPPHAARRRTPPTARRPPPHAAHRTPPADPRGQGTTVRQRPHGLAATTRGIPQPNVSVRGRVARRCRSCRALTHPSGVRAMTSGTVR